MATWYMGPTGIDQLTGGQGTAASKPWLTLKYSEAHMSNNDTLLIAPATYNMTGNTTYIDLDGCTFKSSTPSSTVTFDGSTMTTGQDGIGVSGDGNLFEDLYVNSSKSRGWSIGADDHMAWTNIFRRCGGAYNSDNCFFIGRSPETQLLDCVVSDSGIPADHAHNIYINGRESWSGAHCNDVLIDNLLCSDPAGLSQNSAIHVNGDNDSVIERCIIRNSTFINKRSGGPMDLMNAHDCSVYNNLFYGSVGNKWIRCMSDDGGPMNSDGNMIYNNTFVMSGSTGKTAIWFIHLDGGLALYHEALNCVAFNNLIFSADPSLAFIDTSGNNFVDTVSNKRLTYSSSLINDYFVDAANGDYHLKSTAPARDAGVATYHSVAAPTTDKDGHARPQ